MKTTNPTQKLTAKQVFSKYKGKYIEVRMNPFWDTINGETSYEVHAVHKDIHENTCLCDGLDFYLNY